MVVVAEGGAVGQPGGMVIRVVWGVGQPAIKPPAIVTRERADWIRPISHSLNNNGGLPCNVIQCNLTSINPA